MRFVKNENVKNEQLLTWLKLVHSRNLLLPMIFNGNEAIRNSSVILAVDKLRTTASTLANLSDFIYLPENYTNYSNSSSNFLNYSDEQYNLSLSTEYIFDRTDVRVIFIILYSLVFCCCFFGKLLTERNCRTLLLPLPRSLPLLHTVLKRLDVRVSLLDKPLLRVNIRCPFHKYK